MKNFQFMVMAETDSIKSILTILTEIKNSVEEGKRNGTCVGEDIFYRYSINEIKEWTELNKQFLKWIHRHS